MGTSFQKLGLYFTQKDFDLVILDVGLPDGNGLNALPDQTELGRYFSILTAQADAESRLTGFELGAG